MKLEHFALVLLLVLASFYAGWYLYDNLGEDFFSSAPPAVHQPEKEPRATAEAESSRMPMPPRHPVSLPDKLPEPDDGAPVEPPFPQSLDEADAYLKERLPALVEKQDLLSLLTLKYFIQKLVLIIDHLPEKTIPRQHLPVDPPEPGFLIIGEGEQRVISTANARRYLPYVELLEAIPDPALLRLYQGLYPLFQQAYRETGKPHGHFNDRLVQVLDHLLKTPEPQGHLSVTEHIRRFRFTDPNLESLSYGQKVLLRMGVENTRRVKAKLQAFRNGLTG